MLKIFVPILFLSSSSLLLIGASPVKKNVLILGDSTTTGYPFDDQNGSWTIKLKEINYLNFRIVAKNGITLKELMPKAIYHLNDYNYNYVFLMIGLNEILRGDSQASFQNSLAKLYRLCKKNRAKLIIAYPIALHTVDGELYFNNQKTIQKTLRNFVKKHKLTYIDANILTNQDLFDICHPNEVGYQKMSELFYNFFSNIK